MSAEDATPPHQGDAVERTLQRGASGLSEPFIRRPIGTSLLAAAIILLGAAAYTQLPVAPLPKVDLPTISVNASLPGASPETMSSAVATPLERRLGRIAGLTDMTSTSSLGSTSITLQFDLDRDTDAAGRDVQAAINAAAADLPTNLPFRPNYRKVNPSDTPIMIIALTSATLPLPQVFDAADTVLAQKIAQVEGVGQVFVGGGQQPAVRVQVDPEAAAGVNLTLADVRQVLAGASVNRPIGNQGGELQSNTLATNDQLFRADQYRELLVAQTPGGTVRLGDVAKVEDSVQNTRVAGWTNGVRSVLIIVRRQPGANIIDTVERIKALLPTLASSVSPAIDIQIASDRTQTIRASVKDVETTLVISVILVVLVVFAFLRSARATAIPSVAVPLSILGTFAVMWLLGYSVNNLSLMALTISTGFVVDDAIVVTENIARYIEEGMRPFDAALRGAREIGFTIVSITVSLLAVFIPILLMPGPVGRLFREFAVTLAVAITMSAVVSLTVTPMMAARLLVSAHERRENWLARQSERFFQGLARGYDRSLRAVLAHAWLMLGVVLGAVALTVMLLRIVPTALFPQQDNGLLIGFSEAPQDVSYTTMRDRQIQVNQILGEDPDIASVVSFIGGGPGGGGANTGSAFITLKPRPPRKASADQIIARLRPKLATAGGHQPLPPAGPGRAHRRPPRPDPVPVHPAGPRPDRAQHLGAAGLRAPEAGSRADRRRHRPAVGRTGAAADHRSGQRGPARGQRPRHRRRPLRRVRPAADLRHLRSGQPVPGGDGGHARVPRGCADAGEALRPVELRRPGAPLGAHHHRPGATCPPPSTTRGSSPRSPSPSTWRPGSRWAMRSRRCSPPSRRSACRPACRVDSPATPRPSSSRSPG